MKKILLVCLIILPSIIFSQQSDAALRLIFNMLDEENPSELLDEWELEGIDEHIGEDEEYYPKYEFYHDYYDDQITVITYASNSDYKNQIELYFYNQKMFNDLKKGIKDKGYKQINKIIDYNLESITFKKKNMIIEATEDLHRDEYYMLIYNMSDIEKRKKIGVENRIKIFIGKIESELHDYLHYSEPVDVYLFIDDIVSPFITFFDTLDEVYFEDTFDNELEELEEEIYELLVSSVSFYASKRFEDLKLQIDSMVGSDSFLLPEDYFGDFIDQDLVFFTEDCDNYGREYIEDNISCFSVNKNLDKKSSVKKEFNTLIKNIKSYIQDEKQKIESYIQEGDKFLKEGKYEEANWKYVCAEFKLSYWNMSFNYDENIPDYKEWLGDFDPSNTYYNYVLEKQHLSQYYQQMVAIETQLIEAKELYDKGTPLSYLEALDKYEEIRYKLANETVCQFKFCEWRNECDCDNGSEAEKTWIYNHPENLDEYKMEKYFNESRNKISEIKAILKQKNEQERVWSFKQQNPIKYESFLNQIQEDINQKIIGKNNGEIEFFFKIKFDELGNNLSGLMFQDELDNTKNSIYNESYVNELNDFATKKSTSKDVYSFNEDTNSWEYANKIIEYFVPSEEIIKFNCTWSSEKKLLEHHPTNSAFTQKTISNHPYLKESFGSFKFLTKSVNIAGGAPYIIEKSILEFTSNNGPKYAFYSFLLPGLGTSKVTNGQKGKIKTINFLLTTVASVAAKIYSNMQYDEYLTATNNKDINELYKSADMFHKISLGTAVISAGIYIQDIISAFSQANKNMKKSNLLREKLQEGRIKILNEIPLENLSKDIPIILGQ